METFIDILKITIPALITFLAVYVVLNKFMDNEHKKRMFEYRKENQKLLTPVRIQAYERLILFLERITPVNLSNRVYKNGMSARMMQTEMLKNIRSEYEHNLSQQIFISSEAWIHLKNAKEEVIKIINVAATKAPNDADGISYTKAIYAIMKEMNANPTEQAMEVIKKEVQRYF